MRLVYYTELDAKGNDEARSFDDMDLDQLRDLVAKDDADNSNQPKKFVGHYFIFLKTGKLEDLETAICRAEEQKRIKLGSPNFLSCLKNLIVMLVKKYEHTDSVDDLQEAISRVREMVATTPRDYPDDPAILNDKVAMMCRKYDCTGLQEDFRMYYDAVNEWGR